MWFLVLKEPISSDGRKLFIPPLTPVTLMRPLGANIRMNDSGDLLEIQDDRGSDPCGGVGQRVDETCAQPAGFLLERWSLPASLRAQLKYDPLIARNLPEGRLLLNYASSKRGHQTELVPTAGCCGLDVSDTLNTSVDKATRDDALQEDLVAEVQRQGSESSEYVPRVSRRKSSTLNDMFSTAIFGPVCLATA